MTAHVVYTDIDPDNPATTSPKMIEIIRDTIGFNGLLMTDDISMKALKGPFEARCEAALTAGCDIVLHCNGEIDEMAAVVEASGSLNGVAEARAETALTWRKEPDAIDIEALDAEFEALLTN